MDIRTLHYIVVTTSLTLLPLYGCSSGGSTGTGTGGSSSSSGAGGSGGGAGGGSSSATKEAPDYTKAFPQDRVPRLDIKITQKNWQAMVDDMTTLLGPFGKASASGSTGGGDGSQALIDACKGLKAADVCAAWLAGTAITGICSEQSSGLTCAPYGGQGGDVDLVHGQPNYVECDVKTEDRSWSHVGVRFKGNSSLALPWLRGIWKLPLHLNFDKYEDTYPETTDQRFYGFKSLSLSNGASDPSLLRAKIGTEVFVNAGIPAPATAFYRVFIDHGEGPVYFGLYTVTENPSDTSFLETAFSNHKYNLYKPEGVGAQWATWAPDSLGEENNTDAPDTSDAKALFDALHANRSDPLKWRTNLEVHLNVDRFLHWLALNMVIQNWDSYGRMAHNYYLYAGKYGEFQWIPDDQSYAFSLAPGAPDLSLGLSEVTADWPLIRYLLDDAEYLKVYRSYVAKAAEKDYEPTSAAKRFQSAHDLIKPYVLGAEGEIKGYTFLASDSDFESALAALVAHAKQRQQDVNLYLKP